MISSMNDMDLLNRVIRNSTQFERMTILQFTMTLVFLILEGFKIGPAYDNYVFTCEQANNGQEIKKSRGLAIMLLLLHLATWVVFKIFKKLNF